MCPSKEEEFNEIIVSTISEVLDFSEVILNFLELNTSFKRNMIMKDVDALSNGLRELLGDSGGIIEDIIAKRVYEKLNIPYRVKSGTLKEKLEHAYEFFIVKKK
jgi:5'-deoxynucleotidase YfbR-like HD superfamily hydrolase